MKTRPWLARSSEGFLELTRAVPSDAWQRLGLGQWTVRDLIGHTSRALLTIESYLAASASDGPLIESAADYYDMASHQLVVPPSEIVIRGREAGQMLGADPAAAVERIRTRVLALVADTPDDAVVATRVGRMRLIDYLPTRAFELTVHTLDAVRATGVPVPAATAASVLPALDLAVRIGSTKGLGQTLLLALTGRTGLPRDSLVL